jgi:hypothetical protein
MVSYEQKELSTIIRISPPLSESSILKSVYGGDNDSCLPQCVQNQELEKLTICPGHFKRGFVGVRYSLKNVGILCLNFLAPGIIRNLLVLSCIMGIIQELVAFEQIMNTKKP